MLFNCGPRSRELLLARARAGESRMNAPLARESSPGPQHPSLASRYGGRTVLAIGAHPDDIELAIGGMLARLRASRRAVVMAVVSIPADFETRRAEAQRAAESSAASCAS